MIGCRRDVCNGTVSGLSRPNIQWLGRIHAACELPDIPSNSRGRRRVLRTERKSMLESFVDSHRALNGGKFPPISVARKHVGGSFYTIRWLVQELKHKSESSASDRINASIRKESIRETKPIPCSETLVHHDLLKDSKSVGISNFEMQDLDETKGSLLDKMDESFLKKEHSEANKLIVDKNIEDFQAITMQNVEVQELERPQCSPADNTNECSSGFVFSKLNEPISGSEVKLDVDIQRRSQVAAVNTVEDRDMRRDSQAVAINSLHSGYVQKETFVEDADRNDEHMERAENSQSSSPAGETSSKQIMKPLITHVEKTADTSNAVLDLDGPKRRYEQNQASLQTDRQLVEITGKRFTLWENLRLFANGILERWRNR